MRQKKVSKNNVSSLFVFIKKKTTTFFARLTKTYFVLTEGTSNIHKWYYVFISNDGRRIIVSKGSLKQGK